MKKTYVQPVMKAAFVQTTEQLMAVSGVPRFDGPQIPGPQGLAKQNNWDIFGEDEED